MLSHQEHIELEDAVYAAIEASLQVCRSDAQGIADAQQSQLERAWAQRLPPSEAASIIISHSTPQEGSS